MASSDCYRDARAPWGGCSCWRLPRVPLTVATLARESLNRQASGAPKKRHLNVIQTPGMKCGPHREGAPARDFIAAHSQATLPFETSAALRL
eukprot:2163633-Pyramimonas_sp.AAC.1